MKFRFGVIGDVQWADKEDGYNYDKTVVRRYRRSLEILKDAVVYWKSLSLGAGEFVVQMGDLVDGHNFKLGLSQESMEKALDCLQGLDVKHIVGNHELYNFSREELLAFGYGNAGELYYDFSPCSGWRVVCLDSFDISLCGSEQNSTNYEKACKILADGNPNDLQSQDWFDGLEGVEKRFVPYNGALSEEQLSWLSGILSSSYVKGEKVLIFSHIPLYPECTGPKTLLWNYQKVLDLLQTFPCVVACFYGHDHIGGYALQDLATGKPIHHIVLPSPLEVEDKQCFGHVEVWEDCLKLIGRGIPSKTMKM